VRITTLLLLYNI